MAGACKVVVFLSCLPLVLAFNWSPSEAFITVSSGSTPLIGSPARHGACVFTQQGRRKWVSLRSSGIVWNALSLSANGGMRGRPELGIEDFLRVYEGDFNNEKQLLKQMVQYSRKLHRRIDLPDLGKHCFFVKEQTDTGNGMQYRIRIADVQEVQENNSDRFVVDHYELTAASMLEKEMSEEECIDIVERLVVDYDLERVTTGTVEFTRKPGTRMFDVETSYTHCQQRETTSTEIQGTISPEGWYVKAIFRDSDGEIAHSTELFMDKVA